MLILLVVSPAIARAQDRSLPAIVERMGQYVTAFQQRLANIVAEEDYVQDVTYPNLLPGRTASGTHRELRSDILLVRPQGADQYVEFRDVFEVDRRPVRDRQERLTALFLSGATSAAAQIEQIQRESARYNIGNVERTINTPTLALQCVLPAYQSRFRFTRGGGDDGNAVVGFEERLHPTLIRTPAGLDLPVHGRLWVDAGSGRIARTELSAEDATLRATIDVRYAWDARAQLMIPTVMREEYRVRRDGAIVSGVATYGRVRQFGVTTRERMGPGDPDGTATPGAADSGTPEPPAAAPAETAIAEPSPIARPAPDPDRPKPPPVFRSLTELVLVDFVVTDNAGHPVRGLSSKDVVVKEDGKARPIVSFEAFAPSGSAAVGSGVMPSGPAEATTVVLVDDLHLTPQQAARLRPALRGLLTTVGERSGAIMLVGPASKVSAFAETAATLEPSVDHITGGRDEEHASFPVEDAEALAIARRDLQAIARVAARFLTLHPELSAEQAETIAIEQGVEAAGRVRVRRDRVYDVMLRTLDWLATRPGRHRLILISGGFATDPDDSEYLDVVTRSLRANAPIDVLDARGLSGFDRYHDVEFGPALNRDANEGPYGRFDAAEGPVGLAVDTGGVIVANRNDMRRGLDELLDGMSTYYVVGYVPAPHQKSGYRKIAVDVRGRHLRVRARTGYVSGPSEPR